MPRCPGKRRLAHPDPFANCGDQLATIIGEYGSGLARPRHGDVEGPLIDEVRRLAIGVDQHALGSATLRRERGFDIGVANMPVAGVVQL